jgi:hypothetical protein
VPLPECRARAPERGREPRLAVVARDLLALATIDVEQQACDARRGAVARAFHDASSLHHPQPAVLAGQQPVFAFEAITAVLTGISCREERAEIVGVDAPLPLFDRHRRATHIDAEGARPVRVDVKSVVRESPVPHRRLRELERRAKFGGQLLSGSRLGTGIHGCLLLPACNRRTLMHFYDGRRASCGKPKSPANSGASRCLEPRNQAFS